MIIEKFRFDKMREETAYIYKALWGGMNFDFPVRRTLSPEGWLSNNSYSFTESSTADEEICCRRLIELFGIADEELFREKFVQAISGDGNELSRISVLHSSSLCALLFFYGVCRGNPLRMTLNGAECEFTSSRFEFKNKVIEGRRPSNMDIVLAGRDLGSGRNVLLFLESKFTEYILGAGTSLNVPREYLSNEFSEVIYGEKADELGLRIQDDPDGAEFLLESDNVCYLAGIKQMISHFIGVNNFIRHGSVTVDVGIEKVRETADIYLGEIIFDRNIGNFVSRSGITCADSYREKHGQLIGMLRDFGTPVRLVERLFSYTMFENSGFIRESRILDFYFRMGETGTVAE